MVNIRSTKMKIDLDKYYTPTDISLYCINKTFDIIGKDNITDIIEPSAGNGSFSLQLNCLSYDISPEHESIIKEDFLKLKLPYKKGRLFIGNPPFGFRNSLSLKFYKKCITEGDYISFILPISQLNNTQSMYEFDLIHSEDLGILKYSDRDIHCCFNIYSGINGIKKKVDFKLKDVEVIEYRRGGSYKIPNNYDFGMCTWGNGCGKEVLFVGQYAQEHYLIIKNISHKEEILNICRSTDWRNLYPSVSSPKLQSWKIYKLLKDKIPQLK
jgi:hypothetical protein